MMFGGVVRGQVDNEHSSRSHHDSPRLRLTVVGRVMQGASTLPGNVGLLFPGFPQGGLRGWSWGRVGG